jgi:hypothetical protein
MKDQKIEINSLDSNRAMNKYDISQEKNDNNNIKKPNLVKKVYSNFIIKLKNIATKNKTKEASPSQLPSQSDISTSQTEPSVVQKSTKDKIAQMIINKIEVKRDLKIFLILLGIGSLLLFFSLFLLPFIITSPSKFSMCFAMACSSLLVSFLFLHGTKKYVEKLFDKKRFLFTSLFIISIIIGIITSIGKKYFISLLCSLFQIISAVLFILTFIPGGRHGINCIKKQLSSPFVKLFMKVAEEEVNK